MAEVSALQHEAFGEQYLKGVVDFTQAARL
jgi:hypothetical protein